MDIRRSLLASGISSHQPRPVQGAAGSARQRDQRPHQDAADIIEHPIDWVLLATGFRCDQTLLQQAGVHLEGERRVPQYDPATMEPNGPGLYLAGTVAAGIQHRYTIFIENAHEHVAGIAESITGQRPERIGAAAAPTYSLPFEAIATG